MNEGIPKTISLAICGSGGSGAVTMGMVLLKAIAKAGYYGLMNRSAGPQIRGGESAVMIRLGNNPIDCQDDNFELLLALDWLNFTRFADEIPLTDKSIIVYDPESGEPPAVVIDSGAQCHTVGLKTLAKTSDGVRPNMIGAGILAAMLGIDKGAITQAVSSTLGRKGSEVVDISMAGIEIGYRHVPAEVILNIPGATAITPRWNISGNEACGYGALQGGVRLVAAYPITPATEILEWLAPNLEKVGGTLIQAEDELASINMVIGASFGGVPALTATSGPGMSLMVEAMGLAVASETPLVVIDVMRGGPSTGIPTKSEQGDLNLALYGFHGSAPHLVLAPTGIADCAFTTEWAVKLAERLQTVAIVLSDQSLGQSRVIIEPPSRAPEIERRKIRCSTDIPYQRYALTEDGISTMAVPGTPDCIYTADGLEHNPAGTPSSMAQDHHQQADKRLRKLNLFDYGEHWAELDGKGEPFCLISWGSSCGVVKEAARRLRDSGQPVRVLLLRLLNPLQQNSFQAAIGGAKQVLVVEQNHQGQLFHYLHAHSLLPGDARLHAKPGPLPIRPGDIVTTVKSWRSDG
jgi:2-oxoglutarate ferredoxin oxidoreductase subunit alpha